jgi:GTP-binding protein
VRVVEAELEKYSEELIDKPRWLVMNKLDLALEEDAQAACDQLIADLDWTEPAFRISTVSGEGLSELTWAIMHYLDEKREALAEAEAALKPTLAPVVYEGMED